MRTHISSEVERHVEWFSKFGHTKALNSIVFKRSGLSRSKLLSVIDLLSDQLNPIDVTAARSSGGTYLFRGEPDTILPMLAHLRKELSSSPRKITRKNAVRYIQEVLAKHNYLRSRGSAPFEPAYNASLCPTSLNTYQDIVHFFDTFNHVYTVFKMARKWDRNVTGRSGWSDEWIKEAKDLMTIEEIQNN